MENRRTSRDHPNSCIVEVGRITEKSSEDLRRLAVTQSLLSDITSEKSSQMSKMIIIIIIASIFF